MRKFEGKFKNYAIEYEKVFSGKRTANKCKIEKVSAFNNIPGNTSLYVKMFRDTVEKFQKDLYDSLIKFVWLRSRFCYDGVHRIRHKNGWKIEQAYGIFMKRDIGLNNRTVFASRNLTSCVISYFDDIFPNFDEGNPFEENYEWPFKYMNLDCLVLVHIMPERMYLLEYGEKKKMNYMEFMDYVINYISCYNEEHDDKHEFVFSQNIFNYVRHILPNHKPRVSKFKK